MKSFNYGKANECLTKGENVERYLTEFIRHVEGQYLKFWVTNIELDYITFLEITREKESKWLLDQDELLEKLEKYIVSLLNDPEKLFFGSSKGQQTRLTTLKKYKVELQKRVKLLTSYDDQTKILGYIYNRLEGKFDLKVSELHDDDDFAGLLIKFIFNNEDPVIINDKIKQIYTQLPIRMTKSRFYNYVDDSFNLLKGIEKKQLDAYSQLIKDIIYPEENTACGFLQNLHEMLAVLFKNHDVALTIDELSQLLNSLDLINEKIENATGYYIYAVNLVNELIGMIMTITPESTEAAKASIELFVQIMGKVSQKKRGQTLIDEALNTLLIRTEGVIEGLSIELGQADAFVETAIINYEEQIEKMALSSRFESMKCMPVLSSGSYFAEMEQKSELSDVVDEFYLAYTKKELTKWMDGVFLKGSKMLQRSRMANAFSVLNISHKKPQEVYQFILDALIACNDPEEKTVCKRLLRELMQELDF